MFYLGNPRVTPEVTYDVCLLARLMAANLHLSKIEDLMFEVCEHYSYTWGVESSLGFHALNLWMQLSMWRCSAALKARVNELVCAEKKGAKYYMGTNNLLSRFMDIVISNVISRSFHFWMCPRQCVFHWILCQVDYTDTWFVEYVEVTDT